MIKKRTSHKSHENNTKWNLNDEPMGEIIIDEKDSKFSFLSNSSPHSFLIDNKRWPTVEHFFNAKKFEGTTYEEEIRLAPTILKVKSLVRCKYRLTEDSGRYVKTKIYGKTLSPFYIRSDWNIKEREILEIGIREKFSQNPRLMKKLLSIKNMKIIDPNNKFTGIILNKLKTENTSKPVPKEITHKDLKDYSLNAEEEYIIKKILNVVKRIRNAEYQTNIYSGMIEDTFYNILHDNYKDIKKNVINWVEDINWSNIHKNLPNFSKVCETIDKMIKKLDNKSQIKNAALITAFIKWLRCIHENSNTEYEHIKDIINNSKIRKKNMKLPKKIRWYRASPSENFKRRSSCSLWKIKIYIDSLLTFSKLTGKEIDQNLFNFVIKNLYGDSYKDVSKKDVSKKYASKKYVSKKYCKNVEKFIKGNVESKSRGVIFELMKNVPHHSKNKSNIKGRFSDKELITFCVNICSHIKKECESNISMNDICIFLCLPYMRNNLIMYLDEIKSKVEKLEGMGYSDEELLDKLNITSFFKEEPLKEEPLKDGPLKGELEMKDVETVLNSCSLNDKICVLVFIRYIMNCTHKKEFLLKINLFNL